MKQFTCFAAVIMCLATYVCNGISLKEFESPSEDYRPETWFHLIGGNIAKSGLDADLDAIKSAGIGGIQLFHGQFGGPWPNVSPQIPCLSADWDDFIGYVGEGCAKRGLTFKMQNCPGWSMSGGPWITHDFAMRNLSYSRVDIEGGSRHKLPVPNWQMESALSAKDLDYHDLFVLAFPTPAGDEPKELDVKPMERTDINGVMTLKYDFGRTVTIRAFSVPSTRKMNHDWNYHPEVIFKLWAIGQDGKRILVVERNMTQGSWQNLAPVTFACAAHTAKKWEVEAIHKHPISIDKVTFNTGVRMDDWEGLAGWVLRSQTTDKIAAYDPVGIVKCESIIDISDNLHGDELEWTPPHGERWTVLRIGHVNNGAQNGPAPKEATGWECDKLNRKGIDRHFAAYIGRLAGGALAGGKLKGFVVDSWECKRQTWTEGLDRIFAAECGYELKKHLPSVFGWVIDSQAANENFLLDWRRTLGNLIERNYYARMSELARENGMTAQYETAFGDVVPGDLMAFWKYCDTPMCEFWFPRSECGVGHDDFKPFVPCVSAAHVYGKKRVAAESFTTCALSWDEDLVRLKATANHAFAHGVSHLVFHTYTHNPQTNFKQPGTSFGRGIGTPFIRGQTWWKYMPEFTRWISRCEVLLEAGKPKNDVLWFLGEEIDHKPYEASPFPHGYKYDYVNRDALLTRISVKDGKFVTPDGVSWNVLWAPRMKHATSEVKQRLAEFSAKGGVVRYGSALEAVEGLRRDVVVGSDAFGRKITDWRRNEEQVEWLHRHDQESDWYFVAANNLDAYDGEVTFSMEGKCMMLDPVTGGETQAKVLRSGNGETTIALHLESAESAFIMFSHKKTGEMGNRACKIKELCKIDRGWTLKFPKGWGAPEELRLDNLVSWSDLPISEEGRHFSGTASYYASFNVNGDQLELDLGRVEGIAEVFVNGKCARTLWSPPYRCQIGTLIKPGRNELRVDVTSTWFNRLAYDAGLPEANRKTWTIAAPRKDAQMRPAGLLGPVRIVKKEFVEEVKCSVDFDKEIGRFRGELHSAGYGPVICMNPQDAIKDIKEMGFKASRTHDWALINDNERVCDYFHIFPLLHLDANDPKNYFFGPTDYLLKLTREDTGHDIFYRLGTSIEHSGNKVHFNTLIPTDFDKMAESFAGTIRHYNRGWANGYKWNIKYWEIWNEPDNHNTMWCLHEGDVPDGDDNKEYLRREKRRMELFVEFYVKVLKRLKSEFPEVKIGGPALCSMREDYFRALLQGCKDANISPDFISWHHYEEDPMCFERAINKGRKLCDEYGFTKCELIVNEWHYFNFSDYNWSMLGSSNPEIQRKIWSGPSSHNGIDSSCFNLACLSLFQTSKLDQAYYYGCRHSGLWGYKEAGGRKYKVFHGLKIFGDFAKRYTRLCQATGVDVANAPIVTALAAKSDDGKRKALLISDYRVRANKIEVDVKGVATNSKVTAKVHDYTHDFASANFEFADGKLTLKKDDLESAAFLIEFE